MIYLQILVNKLIYLKKKPKKLEELIKEWETYVLKYDVKLPSERVGYGPDEIYIK